MPTFSKKFTILLIMRYLFIDYYVFVKELMDYLDLLHYGRGNISRVFGMCKAFYRLEKKRSISHGVVYGL